jgi:hypothetical protein
MHMRNRGLEQLLHRRCELPGHQRHGALFSIVSLNLELKAKSRWMCKAGRRCVLRELSVNRACLSPHRDGATHARSRLSQGNFSVAVADANLTGDLTATWSFGDGGSETPSHTVRVCVRVCVCVCAGGWKGACKCRPRLAPAAATLQLARAHTHTHTHTHAPCAPRCCDTATQHICTMCTSLSTLQRTDTHGSVCMRRMHPASYTLRPSMHSSSPACIWLTCCSKTP